MKHWLGAEGRPLMEGLLHPDRLRSEGVLRPDTVQRLKQEHLTGRENHSHVLWSLMVFEDWRDRWAV
jgi:asparagine synthase (glutamine-hydrolysing)